MGKEKFICIGQRFGFLILLGKGEKLYYKKSCGKTGWHQLWKLQCQCGKIIEIQRGAFDGGNQKSCGCARKSGLVDNKVRPKNIADEKFGSLTAIKLSGKKDSSKKPTWELQCDCGKMRLMSLSGITTRQKLGVSLTCGDRTQHESQYRATKRYPPTPEIYPQELTDLFIKYLRFTETSYTQKDSAVEDLKRDRLLRACWILVYRRSRGENISELHEKFFIRKHLQYCSVAVFWQRRIEANGGIVHIAGSKKKQVRETSTPLRDSETTQATLSSQEKFLTKKLRFRRC